MASLSDILSTLQQGVIATNNLITQTKGSFNNIAAQIAVLTAQIAARVISFNGRNGVVSPVQGDYPTSLIPGTTTNDSATAGNIGEYVVSIIAAGSAVALTTNVPVNVTSISLTAGDWDVTGNVGFGLAATTSVTVLDAAINTTSATLPPSSTGQKVVFSTAPNVMAGAGTSLVIQPCRISVAINTTVFLVAQATFTVSTANAFGIISARRPR